MGQTRFSGPVVSAAGFTGDITGDVEAAEVAATTSLTVGSGTAITKMLQGTAQVIVGTVAADAEETKTITVTGAAVGDFAMVSPHDDADEDGLVVAAVWVSAADTVSIKIRNADASVSNLTGSTSNWTYLVTSIA